MSDEVRIDPLTGTPVIVVPSREGRPNLPSQGCPFCVGGLEAPEPYEVTTFVNRWPSLADDRAEVVLFSPDHDASLGTLPPEHVRKVVDAWVDRTNSLGSRADVDYVLIFENRGEAVGATIPHPHGQIYAYDRLPPVPAHELARAETSGQCALCETDAGDRLVARVGSWRAWVPRASAHPYGMVLAPTDHIGALGDLDPAGRDDFARLLGTVLGGLDVVFAEPTPYLWWMHQRPTDGGAWPWAHLHIEIVPHRRARGVSRYVAAAELGSGMMINSIDPRAAAASLREACASMGTS